MGDDGSPLMWIKNGLSTGLHSFHSLSDHMTSEFESSKLILTSFILVVGIYSNNEPVEESNVAGWFCKAGSAFTRVSTYYDWIKSHDIGDVCD